MTIVSGPRKYILSKYLPTEAWAFYLYGRKLVSLNGRKARARLLPVRARLLRKGLVTRLMNSA